MDELRELWLLWSELIDLLENGASIYDEKANSLIDEIEHWFDTHPQP